MKIAFCTPTLTKPHLAFLKAMERSVPLIHEQGWEEISIYEIGCPYISAARATMLRKALTAGCDTIVFIDHDMSWDPQDLVTLIETKGDVVAGTYRFKKDEVEYMAVIDCNSDGTPRLRYDNMMYAEKVPAGFLKVTKKAVQKFMKHYPELLYGDPDCYSVDLFNHGAFEGVWYGEDYAFSRRWRAIGEIILVPNLNLHHHSADKVYPGNFHEFMLAQPGGSNDHNRT